MAYLYKNPGATVWRIQYTNAAGKRVDLKGFSDKKQTKAEAARLEDRVTREKRGIIDHAAEAVIVAEENPLAAHLDDWRDSIIAKATPVTKTAKTHYANQQRRRVHRILIGELEYTRISQINTNDAQAAIAVLMAGDNAISQQTAAHFVQALRQFGKWLWKPARRSLTPLLDDLTTYTVTTQARPRAAFTDEEIATLIESTKASKEYRFKMDGPTRAMCYLLAAVTGFRRAELASLIPTSITHNTRTWVIELPASQTKNKKPVTMALPDWVVTEFMSKFKNALFFGPNVPLFPLPDQTSRMLQLDLAAAKIPTTLHRDFHCLRHTAITNWAKRTDNIRLLMDLARHSNPKTTMRYTHSEPAEREALIEESSRGLAQNAQAREQARTEANRLGKGTKGKRSGRKPSTKGANDA